MSLTVASPVTCQHVVNKTVRTFAIKEREVSPALKADLVSRGWDGTVWFGETMADDRANGRKTVSACFQRTAKSNEFVLIFSHAA